jgi:hypothetical protein
VSTAFLFLSSVLSVVPPHSCPHVAEGPVRLSKEAGIVGDFNWDPRRSNIPSIETVKRSNLLNILHRNSFVVFQHEVCPLPSLL